LTRPVEVTSQHIILAFDPGLTTGWAALDLDSGGFISGQTEGRHAFYRQVEAAIAGGALVEAVGEKYTITQRTAKLSAQYDALYIIGMMDYLSEKCGFPLTLQTPAQAKAFATDAKLKAVGWYTPTKGGHANDASRHLLTYVSSRKQLLAGKPLLTKIVEALGL
jgi:hypothetical protein